MGIWHEVYNAAKSIRASTRREYEAATQAVLDWNPQSDMLTEIRLKHRMGHAELYQYCLNYWPRTGWRGTRHKVEPWLGFIDAQEGAAWDRWSRRATNIPSWGGRTGGLVLPRAEGWGARS